MPELPEVEYGRKLAERVAQNCRIEKVWCDKDELVFCDAKPRKVKSALTGRTVTVFRFSRP